MSAQQAQPATPTSPNTPNELRTTIPPTSTMPTTTLPTSYPPVAHTLPAANTFLTLPENQALIDPAILQSGSFLSGLLAAVAAQLLVFFKDDSNFENTEWENRASILQLTYVSLVSSIFATTSALALTVASIEVHKRRRSSVFFIEIVFVLWVISLVIVTASTVASIVIYVSTNERDGTRIVVYPFAGLVGLLLVWFTFETISTFTTETWRRKRDKWKAARANR